MKLYFAKSDVSIRSMTPLRAAASTLEATVCYLPNTLGSYDFFTNSIAPAIMYALAFDVFSYVRRVYPRSPMSCPPFLAFRIAFDRYATSLMPRLSPCPARGWTLWAASPIRAMRWDTYPFDIYRASGKAYLLVCTSEIKGGVSNYLRFI